MRSENEQLNPFAFPSETCVRFTLLVLAAIVLSINLGFVLADRLGLPSPAQLAEKTLQASNRPPPGTANLPGGTQAYQTYFQENLRLLGDLLLILGLPSVLTIALLTLACTFYRLHPLWVRLRTRRQQRAATEDRELCDEVDRLAARASRPAVVHVEIVGTSRQSMMRIFGFPWRYRLLIGGRWRVVLRKAPATFRAVVLHELGHMVNGDIGRVYFSRALWIALVGLALIPFVVLATMSVIANTLADSLGANGGINWPWLLNYDLPRLGFLYTQIACSLLVVAAVRASLLRARELYADWRVVLWGARQPLETLIASQPATTPDSIARRLQALWRFHPSAQARLDTLRSSRRLFHLALDMPFFVGFFFVLVVVNAVFLFGTLGVLVLTLLEIWNTAILADPLPSNLFIQSSSLILPLLTLVSTVGIGGLLAGAGYLLTETLGLEVQRAAAADLAISRDGAQAYLRLWKPAAAAALGLQTAILLTPYSPLIASGWMALVLGLIWTIALAGLIWLWLIYIRGVARALLAVHTGPALPTRKRRICSFISFCLACVMFVPAILVQQVGLPLMAATGTLEIATVLLVLSATLALALASYIVIGTFSWIGIRWWRYSRSIICTACNRRTSYRQSIGKYCDHCGANLAPWLFVGTGPSDDTSALAAPPATDVTTAPKRRLAPTNDQGRRQRIGLAGGIVIGTLLSVGLGIALATQYAALTDSANESPLSSVYRVRGSNFLGQEYTGVLTIVQKGETQRLTWDTNAGTFTGVGIQDGDILAVAYGSLERCSVVVYRIRGGGLLEGRLSVPGQQQLGAEHASRHPGPRQADLSGVYDVRVPGVAPNVYSGLLTITADGPVYQLDWKTNRAAFTGTGIQRGDVLAAVYGAPDCGLVVYQRQPNSMLDGLWTVQGTSERGTELASPVE